MIEELNKLLDVIIEKKDKEMLIKTSEILNRKLNIIKSLNFNDLTSYVMGNVDNQGEKEWLMKTRDSIGGSTVSYITGNSYGSMADLIEKKMFEPFEGNIYTNFGSFMEDIYRICLSKRLNTPIHVMGAVPWIKEGNKMLAHYSMDGILKADLSKLRNANGFKMGNEVKTCLLEIKFPWSREIKVYKTNKVGVKGQCIVPKSYLDQVKFGLRVIEPAEVGLFTDCLGRMCPLKKMSDPLAYSNAHHFNADGFPRKERNEIKKVMYYGVTEIFTHNLEDTLVFRNADLANLTEIPKTMRSQVKSILPVLKEQDIKLTEFEGEPIDFGYDFKELLSEFKDDVKNGTKIYKLKHRCFIVDNPYKPDIQLSIDTKQPNLLGYLCWKIFDVKYAIVNRDPTFLDDKIEEMKRYSKLFYSCRDKSDDEKIRLINDFDAKTFPSHK